MVGFLLLLSLVACSPSASGYIVGEAINGDAVTVTSTWNWPAESQPKELTLAGIFSPEKAGKPLIALRLREIDGGWWPRWQVQLEVRRDGSTEILDVAESGFYSVEDLEVKLSYDPGLQVVSFRVTDLSGNTIVLSGGAEVTLGEGPFAPLASQPGNSTGPFLVSMYAESGYRPLADIWEIGERLPDGTFIPTLVLDQQGENALRLTSPVRSPGKYDLALTTYPPGSYRLDLGSVEVVEAETWIRLPMDQLLPGPTKLTIDYANGNGTMLSRAFDITVGRSEFSYTFGSPIPGQSSLPVVLSVHASGPLPGVNAQVLATRTLLASSDIADGTDQETYVEEVSVLTKSFDVLRESSPVTLSIPLPEAQGVWKLTMHTVLTPEVSCSSLGGIEYVSTRPTTGDFPIATTEQTSRRIMVFDSAINDWDKPEALRWSWQPTVSLGYSLAEVSLWRGPSDVKLRYSDVLGGQYLVATAGDLATIAAYPSGVRYWATFLGSGVNPHAVELLPDGNIAVAASDGGWVRVYTSSQGADSRQYAEYPLPGAHGVLWDPQLGILWAVGDYLLVAIEVTGTAAQPVLEKLYDKPLPTNWGHDLSPVYGNTDRLWVSTGSRVYQYVKSTNQWLQSYPGADLLVQDSVKSIGNQPSGRLVMTRPRPGTLYPWTTDAVQLTLPGEERRRSSASFYKARVWSPDYQ